MPIYNPPAGGGGGGVTSVGVSSATAAISVSGSPITGAGTITLTPNTFTSVNPGVVSGSGGGTSNFLRADGTWAAPGGGGSPAWHGNIYGAYGGCDPQELLGDATRNGTVAATPTNIAITVARIAYFRAPAAMTVNRIRWRGVGNTTNLYRIAVYNGDTLARVNTATLITTAAATWGSIASTFSLVAGQLYFIAVSPAAVGTTAGLLCMSPTTAASTGTIGTRPKDWPGNLDIDAGYITGAFAQFATTAGALPDPAPAIAVQAAWTGGFPAFWLDNNSAA